MKDAVVRKVHALRIMSVVQFSFRGKWRASYDSAWVMSYIQYWYFQTVRVYQYIMGVRMGFYLLAISKITLTKLLEVVNGSFAC